LNQKLMNGVLLLHQRTLQIAPSGMTCSTLMPNTTGQIQRMLLTIAALPPMSIATFCIIRSCASLPSGVGVAQQGSTELLPSKKHLLSRLRLLSNA